MTGNPPHRIYGRVKSHKLRPRQAKLVDEVLPRLRPDLAADNKPRDWFAREYEKYALEIGFGGGEHLAARAKASPDTGFIGCEPFINGVAKLLADIAQNQIDNIAVRDDDARDMLAALPDASLAQGYLLYPDPWPKKRHHKRRFINQDNLDQLFRVLSPDATFLVASDIGDYLDWTLVQMRAHGGFEWQVGALDTPDSWTKPPDDWPSTRYEAKALRAGRRPGYLCFTRRARAKRGTL